MTTGRKPIASAMTGLKVESRLTLSIPSKLAYSFGPNNCDLTRRTIACNSSASRFTLEDGSMLWIDQLKDKSGQTLAGFFVRNRQGKILATGALGHFLQMRHQRYANDQPLVSKIERLLHMSCRQ
jgi:hypothetical protein